jgi:hypothetical protein
MKLLCLFETYMQQTPVVDDQSHEQGPLEMVGNCFSGENHISLDPVVHTPVAETETSHQMAPPSHIQMNIP